jgi:DNA modification methylase
MKRILDSFPKYKSFNTFIYGNFYESIRKKNEALKKYNSIKENKGNVRFSYYTKVIQRIKELEKKNSNLLNGVFWQTGRPRLKYQN